jgi:hypothetical protein
VSGGTAMHAPPMQRPSAEHSAPSGHGIDAEQSTVHVPPEQY